MGLQDHLGKYFGIEGLQRALRELDGRVKATERDIRAVKAEHSADSKRVAELEAQVTKTVEDGVSGVEGVRHIASSITDGLSVTTIQFALETNTDRALNDVKDAVTRVRSNLPQNVTEPLIQRVDVIGLPIVTYAAISPGKTPEQLSWFVDDVVKRALQGVRGVAVMHRANRYGRVSDYYQRANDEMTVLVQIESLTALKNIEAIAAVDPRSEKAIATLQPEVQVLRHQRRRCLALCARLHDQQPHLRLRRHLQRCVAVLARRVLAGGTAACDRWPALRRIEL